MHDLSLTEIDRDGAVQDALAGVIGLSRADALRGAFVGAAGLLAAINAPAALGAPASVNRDRNILNFALSLEYLQADFYTEAIRLGALRGPLRRQATIVGEHERGHVDALRATLGPAAIRRPSFNFRGATEDPDLFRATAVAFEDLGTAAYKGQAPNISSKEYLASAIAIHSVEARHAAWIRRLAGKTPAATAFDEPVTQSEARRLVLSTKFTVTVAAARRDPTFTG